MVTSGSRGWRAVRASPSSIARQLLRSAFYVFFLHEQFHHKVESLGFRLLISTGSDRYRPYKAKVYRASYLTPDCLEETLANAESYRRLGEPRYTQRVDKPIRDGLRDFLRHRSPRSHPAMLKACVTWPRRPTEMASTFCNRRSSMALSRPPPQQGTGRSHRT